MGILSRVGESDREYASILGGFSMGLYTLNPRVLHPTSFLHQNSPNPRTHVRVRWLPKTKQINASHLPSHRPSQLHSHPHAHGYTQSFTTPQYSEGADIYDVPGRGVLSLGLGYFFGGSRASYVLQCVLSVRVC